MAVLSNFFSLAFVYFVLVRFSECSEDTCVKKGPCKCVFPNGTGIDLSPTTLTSTTLPFYTTKDFKTELLDTNKTKITLSTYYFHPCADISVAKPDTCNKPLSMYRDDTTVFEKNATVGDFHTTYLCEYLGNVELLTFTPDASAIVYDNSPSKTIILLTCSEGATRLHMYSDIEPSSLQLNFYSKHACLQQLEEPGRSFGSTLLIVFFSLVIFYLVLGVCTKKFLMGATGIEFIPNLAFWTDLPNLVKDGWAFAISGFKLPPRGVGPTASDPNSYDSI